MDSSNPSAKTLSKVDKARFYIQLANSCLLEGDPTEALRHLNAARNITESLPELFHSYALAYYAKKNIPLAHESAVTAVKMNPQSAESNNTLGKILMDMGKLDAAAPYLKKAALIPTNKEAFKAWTSLGIIAYRRNKSQEALESLDKAIEDAPDAACIAYYYRGHLNLKKAKWQDAVSDYTLASKRFCAKFSDARYALAIAYQKSGQYDLARKTLVEVQKMYPNTKVASQAVETLKTLP
jgi:Tfp pilus assembly protein PilF